MGRNTRIDWADASWNPVTGCLHGCPYCYAKGITKRFGGHLHEAGSTEIYHAIKGGGYKLVSVNMPCAMHILDKPFVKDDGILPYPFDPLLYNNAIHIIF